MQPAHRFPSEIALSITAAAKATGLSRGTLYSLIRDGRIRPRKCGRRTLLLCKDLHALIEAMPDALDPEPSGPRLEREKNMGLEGDQAR